MTDEEFVRLWNSRKRFDTIAKRFKVPTRNLLAYVNRLRRAGYRLKPLDAGVFRPTDKDLELVRAWNASRSPEELTANLGYIYVGAASRVRYLRDMGMDVEYWAGGDPNHTAFIRAWNDARSAWEVARRFLWTLGRAMRTAEQLREEGVKLKRLRLTEDSKEWA
jgi:hypothetical protein